LRRRHGKDQPTGWRPAAATREIGEWLVLGQATVKTHVNRIFAKIGMQSRAQAVRFAISNGLARPGNDSAGP
jgi:hypothetical protein